ncbi:DUF6440 family protein [Intestinibacillus sp. Marseille-P6563]|uniref:DUF6440 family protein n=1 Tax=Intestinibacillus sp. Marseille-P6563 TaxID=2364792 RepID=UPI000F050C5A|nr:DUF6440 family protein [Intestinibacillus sp. Marseille-P6563]
MDKLPKSEKIFYAVLLLIFILCWVAMIWDRATSEDLNRFQQVYMHNGNEIYVDTETNVMYFKRYDGMSIMTDADGKPLIWEGN